ncbi:hypothetical protein [Mycobacterium intracellulare]|uniref:hypothetical protein n=1 Tax=Mycobacterium intracellulare TaxID=1767 RepID=UPI002592796B|nr:hypothetical protein [Mycobacterium intracellulare]MDM3894772.1 hypothetical protein [Mycobacterium intracellulare]
MRVMYVKTDPLGSGHKFWFPLYIYPTTKELQQAAKRFNPNESDAEFWEDCYGCFHPSNSWRYDRKGRPQRTPRTSFIGVMRLTTEHLDPGIVVHESGHAAIALVKALRLTNGFKVGDSNIVAEEMLCYSVQEISMAIMKHLGMVPN